jgi:hypothetical protein
VYLACGLFFCLIAPDIVWNVRMDDTDAATTYRRHLARIGGIGFSRYPLAFFHRDLVEWLEPRLTGRRFVDYIEEYETMNPILGLLLLGSVAAVAFRPALARGRARPFFLILFGLVFGFFTLMIPSDQTFLDPVSWAWVDSTLIPAVILAGACLAAASLLWRIVLWPTAFAGILLAVERITS